MGTWLITSIVLSVGLTVALNVLPRLFPNTARKAEAKVLESMQQPLEERLSDRGGVDNGDRRSTKGVKVFFPWKAMLIGSVLLTVVLNIGRWLG